MGAPLADLALARIPERHAGSASGVFNTAIQLGIAVGTALTAPILFDRLDPAELPAGPSARTLLTGVFADGLWYTIGALVSMAGLAQLLLHGGPARSEATPAR
ncbi:hypothetical protein ACN20G_33180 (plasmid) [Streptomyces sp. BI20]|uniref:hypothetical protein n=1 Tax=Streptomyces sp. BI20 TaxID=3403460 RepID=UPI003C74E6E9